MKEEDCYIKYKRPKKENPKIIIGFNRRDPGFSMYNNALKDVILPPIGKTKFNKKKKNKK